jgi:hypothetical protein
LGVIVNHLFTTLAKKWCNFPPNVIKAMTKT